MTMLQEQRHIYYDRDLNIEAYNLSGIVQKFPMHFHDFYVIGFMEGGKRHLWCNGKEYDTKQGDVLLFNPKDPHYCVPVEGELLDYRALNINPDVMMNAIQEITGEKQVLKLNGPLLPGSDIAGSIRDVYDAIVRQLPRMVKEESFYFLLEQLLQRHGMSSHQEPRSPQSIQVLCDYMDTHYMDNISLDTLCEISGYQKYRLLRVFTKEARVSPYRYLQSRRIAESKKFLEQGMSLSDVALTCGFSDQSHFTNFFKSFIGITPKQYQNIFIDHRNKESENQNEE